MPRIRAQVDDFEVEEIPLYEPSGRGNFLYLWVEKRLANTDEIATDLARALGIRRREVGYAGRKDHRAVTRQAFTVPSDANSTTMEQRLAAWERSGVEVLRVDRHDHRLRAGQLAGNRFRLVVREVDAEQAEATMERCRRIAKQGLPNRFGRQRYGRDGRNAQRGMAILRGEPFRGSRQQAWLMINAAQSRVFDAVLERRPIDRLLKGDLAVVHATGEWLWVDDPERYRPRLEAFELSPTGPLVGVKVRRPRGEVAALEKAVAEELGLPDPDGLRLPYKLQVSGDRRALRIRPGGMEHTWDPAEGMLELAFELPPGSYATVLLEELFPEGFEEGPGDSEEG